MKKSVEQNRKDQKALRDTKKREGASRVACYLDPNSKARLDSFRSERGMTVANSIKELLNISDMLNSHFVR